MHVLLEPHLDDAVLFASYTLLRHKPTVITVCSDATVQERYGIPKSQRLYENGEALASLGVAWEMLGISDERPDWDAARGRLRPHLVGVNTLWVPWPEVDGHDQHNAVADLGLTLFPGEIRYYATYRRGSGRTRLDHEVVSEREWPAFKFTAMSHYPSQINLDNTRFWFTTDWDREWTS